MRPAMIGAGVLGSFSLSSALEAELAMHPCCVPYNDGRINRIRRVAPVGSPTAVPSGGNVERRIEELKIDCQRKEHDTQPRGIYVLREFITTKKTNVFVIAEQLLPKARCPARADLSSA
jgi:hypothetical protein